MTAKEYLLQASTIRRQVKRTEEKIQEIETLMQNVRAIRYDKLQVQSSPSGDRLAEEYIRLEAAKELMIQQAADYYTIYHTIENQINQMPKLYRDILWLRYLEETSLDRIAEILSYSDKYIQNEHGAALQEFGRRFLGE